MKIRIPMRQMFIYESDDGRKIEELKKVGELKDEIEIEDDFKVPESIFYGMAMMNSQMGPQEIKFPIIAKTLEEAFDEYPKCIEKIIEEMESENSQIVVPTMEETEAIKGSIIY